MDDVAPAGCPGAPGVSWPAQQKGGFSNLDYVVPLPACYRIVQLLSLWVFLFAERQESALAGMGYFVHTETMTPTDCGIPQSRPRLYILGIRKDCLPVSQHTHLSWSACFASCRLPLVPLRNFILPADDPRVVIWEKKRQDGPTIVAVRMALAVTYRKLACCLNAVRYPYSQLTTYSL